MKRNTMSFFKYTAVMMFFNAIFGIFFTLRIYDENRLSFFGTFIIWYAVIVLAGLTLTYRNHKNLRSALAMAVLPYGAYCFVAYNDEIFSSFGFYLTCAFTIAILYYFARIFFRAVPQYRDVSVVMAGRTKMMLRKSYMTLGALSAYVFLVVFFCISAGSIQNTGTVKNVIRNADASSISFSLSDWEHASRDKKKEYAQKVVDYECGKLCIKPLSIYVDSRMQDHQYGYYLNSKNMIAISEKRLNKGSMLEVLDAICHEAYHALEYSLIQSGDIYNGNSDIEKAVQYRITQYKSEFKNYKDYKASGGILSFYKYYNQKCEADSRAYADVESVVLYKVVLLNGG